jgi:hypothetical protein
VTFTFNVTSPNTVTVTNPGTQNSANGSTTFNWEVNAP